MLRCVIVKGLQYEGETLDDMDRREREMQEHNDNLDRLLWLNSLPMLSMRDWAFQRGLIKRRA
jgi:hypothetical protein